MIKSHELMEVSAGLTPSVGIQEVPWPALKVKGI